MENEVTIPVLKIYQCPRCQKKAVQPEGSTLLCQSCVNEFLAANVGVMQPVVEDDLATDPTGVVPLPPLPPMGDDV